MLYPTYQYRYGPRMQVSNPCPLCGQEARLLLQKRVTEVRLNDWIPLGSCREILATCSQCEKEYLIHPDLTRTLLPGKTEKRLLVSAWQTLPVPFLSLALMTLAFSRSPETSNSLRSRAKVGLVPSALITLGFVLCL